MKLFQYIINYACLNLLLLGFLFQSVEDNNLSIEFGSLVRFSLIIFIIGVFVILLCVRRGKNINKILIDLNMNIPVKESYSDLLQSSDYLTIRCDNNKNERTYFVSDHLGNLLYIIQKKYRSQNYHITSPYGDSVATINVTGNFTYSSYKVTCSDNSTFTITNDYKSLVASSIENNISLKKETLYNYTFKCGQNIIGESLLPNGNDKFNSNFETDLRVFDKNYRLQLIIFSLTFLGNSNSNDSFSRITFDK